MIFFLFGIGVTIADFQSTGKFWHSRLQLKILVILLQMPGAVVRRSPRLIPSSPVNAWYSCLEKPQTYSIFTSYFTGIQPLKYYQNILLLKGPLTAKIFFHLNVSIHVKTDIRHTRILKIWVKMGVNRRFVRQNQPFFN